MHLSNMISLTGSPSYSYYNTRIEYWYSLHFRDHRYSIEIPMNKSIIIIGAGIAGLSAGCYAQMNGYRTKIFELHELPGGLCTAWERKDYMFDGCIHYLFGSAQGAPFNNIWQELGALQGRQFVNHSEFMRVTSGDGRELVAFSDPDRLEQHIKEQSPSDSPLAEDLANGVRRFTSFDMSLLQKKPRSLMSLGDWLDFLKKMMPFVPSLAKWGLVSAQDIAQRFKDPFLREAFQHVFGWPEIPMMAALSLLAYMHVENAGFPVGGSLEFARALERRYLELGGDICYKSQVMKVLVDKDLRGRPRAGGVQLYDDSEHRADWVISTADGRSTIFDMLDGRFINGSIRKLYDGHMAIRSQIQVSLGVNRDLSAEPHWITYLLPEPLSISGEEQRQIGIKHYCFDPSLAPNGKSVIEVMIPADYAYWQHIYGRKLYDTEQIQVEGIVIDFLEKLYPGIRGQIEIIDVATPLSYERYTGNWLGSTSGWLPTNESMRLMLRGVSKTLPGLKDFYLAGQWVEPGGSVPLAAMSGRNAIQLICRDDRQPFTTSVPV